MTTIKLTCGQEKREISEICSLLHVLYTMTEDLNFENLYFFNLLMAAGVATAKTEILKSELAAKMNNCIQ